MAHSTTVNPNDIKAQAQKHDDTAADIGTQLDQLKAEVDGLLQRSWSGATQALQTTCDNWVENLRKSTLDHLTNMATNIRNEADNLGGTDDESVNAINNVSMSVDTSSFLGATSV